LWERACPRTPSKKHCEIQIERRISNANCINPVRQSAALHGTGKKLDVLAQKIAAGFQNVPEQEGAAEIEKAIRAARE
jgi:hypothetical protein